MPGSFFLGILPNFLVSIDILNMTKTVTIPVYSESNGPLREEVTSKGSWLAPPCPSMAGVPNMLQRSPHRKAHRKAHRARHFSAESFHREFSIATPMSQLNPWPSL